MVYIFQRTKIMGCSWKNPNRGQGGGQGHNYTYLRKTLEFLGLLLYIWKFQRYTVSPLEIMLNSVTPLEISRQKTKVQRSPALVWKFHINFFDDHPWKFHFFLTDPQLITFVTLLFFLLSTNSPTSLFQGHNQLIVQFMSATHPFI